MVYVTVMTVLSTGTPLLSSKFGNHRDACSRQQLAIDHCNASKEDCVYVISVIRTARLTTLKPLCANKRVNGCDSTLTPFQFAQ